MGFVAQAGLAMVWLPGGTMEDGPFSQKHLIRNGAIAAVIIVVLLSLLYYCQLRPGSVTALHADGRGATLELGDAVVTGFSGVVARSAGASADLTFIDVNGPSARIFDPRKPGSVWSGQYWAAPRLRDIPASAVGQVFGVTIDDDEFSNIYLTATSMYGLNIVSPDRNHDQLPDRMKEGQADADWMVGQFGPGGGPGSIWKIDGRTGAVTRFAEVSLNGEPIGPAALGNIAYDSAHRQLFVSDLASGDIHRFDLTGKYLGAYDHGVTGRQFAHLTPVTRKGRVDIHSNAFLPSDPATWGLAPAARRVFGLAFNPNDQRLYYAVADGQIWSIGLGQDGDFVSDARIEVDVPGGAAAAPVSDIVFTRDGAMIAAQRGVTGTQYDYTPLARGAVAHVWRFWPAKPFDPRKPRHFYQAAEEYGVGYAGDNRNSAGGVALGYGYNSDGTINLADCEDAIFFTGDMLRDFHQTAAGFEPAGPLQLYGLQISPKGPVRGFDVPPEISYFVNYTDRMDSANRSGMVGDVAVYRDACRDPACAPPPGGTTAVVPPTQVATGVPPANPPGNPPHNPPNNPPGDNPGDGCTGGDCGSPCIPGTPGCGSPCVTPDCCTGGGCDNPVSKVCKVVATPVCDTLTGTWSYQLATTDTAGIGIDMLTVHSTTSGVNVSNGPDITLIPPPGAISLSGAAPGQMVHIDVCAFKNSDRQSNQPYDCCHTRLNVRIPTGVCTMGGH